MGDYYHLTLFADLKGKPEELDQRDAVIERLQTNFRTNSFSHGGTTTSKVEHYRSSYGDDIKRLTHVCHVKTRDHDALLETLEKLEPFVARHGLMGYLASQSDSIEVIWNDCHRGIVLGTADEFERRDDEYDT